VARFVPVIAADGETVQSTATPSRAGIVEIEVACRHDDPRRVGSGWRFLREVLRAVKTVI